MPYRTCITLHHVALTQRSHTGQQNILETPPAVLHILIFPPETHKLCGRCSIDRISSCAGQAPLRAVGEGAA